jgi:hypothetical protein
MRMLIVFTLLAGCAGVAAAVVAAATSLSPEASAVAAATPSPDATQTVTLTATPSLPAAQPTTEVEPSPTATPTPCSCGFTLSGRLVVDANGNGVADAGDAAPLVVGLNLSSWSTADQILAPTPVRPPEVVLYSAPDGSFVFERIPADSYTLRIYWPFGFESKGAIAAAPHLLRAAFRVTEKGEIVPPDPLPQVWPGSLEPFMPGEPILGMIPNPILLKNVENPNIVLVPVEDAGTAGPPPVGSVDVAAMLGRTGGPAHLPSTGAASTEADGWRGYLALTAGALVALAIAAALVRRART